MRNPSGLRPNKKLSQVFLRDVGPCVRICDELSRLGCRTVLEIGPGPGILTQELLERGFRVVAVERDHRFVADLSNRFKKELDAGDLTLVSNSILKVNLADFALDAVCGNIPYHLSSAILNKCFPYLEKLRAVIFLVQLEFAQRLTASSGGKDYGRLSVYAQLQARLELLEVVQRQRFYPVPKVDSALVKLERNPEALPVALFQGVETVTRFAFSQRRKKISNSLKSLISPQDLKKLGIDPDARCELLSVDDFVRIARHLQKD